MESWKKGSKRDWLERARSGERRRTDTKLF